MSQSSKKNTYDVTNSSSSMASSPIPSYENWLADLYWKNKDMYNVFTLDNMFWTSLCTIGL